MASFDTVMPAFGIPLRSNYQVPFAIPSHHANFICVFFHCPQGSSKAKTACPARWRTTGTGLKSREGVACITTSSCG